MSRLADRLADYSTIGVVGMCKNAGKTTVVNHLIDLYHDKEILGITSIGYDGEELDEITMLEKPRIEVYPGMHVATCISCLENATAKYRKIKDTGIMTALGEVCIIKIKVQGIVEVSGPSMVSQIEVICSMMKKAGCDKIIVDGAAGRTSFASRLECTVLSVGAAMSKDMRKVIALAEHQIDMFSLKRCEQSYSVKYADGRAYMVLKSEDEVHCIFRGALVNEDLDEIINKYKSHKKIVVVDDASSIFITPRTYGKFLRRSGEICVQNAANLAAVTINPMSPYGRWFDKDKFLIGMQERTQLPVYNVMDEKVEDGQ